ncbi:MAG: hypothetical protein LBV19_06585 [Streptococcaceae bacterium]|jgi:hypothetical protein|nr:hypothetical protein [Streptococcaceae bacterium]
MIDENADTINKAKEQFIKEMHLAAKDGFVHTLMVMTFSTVGNGHRDEAVLLDSTDKINAYLNVLQKLNYEIVDIKLTAGSEQGITKKVTKLYALIMYK